jgi:urease accessory protein
MPKLCAVHLKRVLLLAAGVALTMSALSSPAMAHVGHASSSGFAHGFSHPFSGLDHLLAMVAVGLWAAQLGRPAYLILPLTFPLVMAAGAVLGIAGLPLPWVESAMAASVLILGAMVALTLKPSLTASVTLIGLFAFMHGHSHGTELPHAVSAATYAAGFLTGTLMLHAVGLAIGGLSRWPRAAVGLRAAGAAVAAIGVLLLVSA